MRHCTSSAVESVEKDRDQIDVRYGLAIDGADR